MSPRGLKVKFPLVNVHLCTSIALATPGAGLYGSGGYSSGYSTFQEHKQSPAADKPLGMVQPCLFLWAGDQPRLPAQPCGHPKPQVAPGVPKSCGIQGATERAGTAQSQGFESEKSQLRGIWGSLRSRKFTPQSENPFLRMQLHLGLKGAAFGEKETQSWGLSTPINQSLRAGLELGVPELYHISSPRLFLSELKNN